MALGYGTFTYSRFDLLYYTVVFELLALYKVTLLLSGVISTNTSLNLLGNSSKE